MPAKIAARLIEEIRQEMRAEVAAKQGIRERLAGRLLTAKEAAEYIGRSEQAMRHLIHQRDIPVVRMGRCVRIDRRDLDTWIENNKV
jgi:excisionase family DNA binding protein